MCSNNTRSEMFSAATRARLRHWQLLGVSNSSSVQLPRVPRPERAPEPYPSFGGEQGRAGGKGLMLLLREGDQTLNTHSTLQTYSNPHILTISFFISSQEGSAAQPQLKGLWDPTNQPSCARINIQLFYAHYFFTWFSIWKFKIPPSLIFTGKKQSHQK